MFVQKIKCSRCPKTTERDVTAEEIVASAKAAIKPTHTAMSLTMQGQTLYAYENLCPECTEIVAKHVQALGPVTKSSALRERKK